MERTLQFEQNPSDFTIIGKMKTEINHADNSCPEASFLC